MDGAQPVDVRDSGPIVDPQPSRVEAWFHDSRLWLWGPGLVALAIATGILAANVVPWSCYTSRAPGGCDVRQQIEDGLIVLTIGWSVAAAAAFLLWFMRLLGDWGVRRRRAEIEPRIAQAKEWFLRADLDEGEFLALESALKAHADASSPGPRRRVAARAFLFVGIPLTLTAFGFGVAMVDFAVSDWDEDAPFAMLTVLTFGLAGAGAFAITTGTRFYTQARILIRRGRQALDQAEHEVLKRARSRRVGGRVAVVATEPSFRSWR